MQSANQILLSNETNKCAYFNTWEIEVHGGEESKRRMQKNLLLRYKTHCASKRKKENHQFQKMIS